MDARFRRELITAIENLSHSEISTIYHLADIPPHVAPEPGRNRRDRALEAVKYFGTLRGRKPYQQLIDALLAEVGWPGTPSGDRFAEDHASLLRRLDEAGYLDSSQSAALLPDEVPEAEAHRYELGTIEEGPPVSDRETSQQAWRRLRVSARSIKAAIVAQPKHLGSLAPQIDEVLAVLNQQPTLDAIQDVRSLLEKMQDFVAKWRPSDEPSPGVLYIQPPWASTVDDECSTALDLLGSVVPVSVAPSQDKLVPLNTEGNARAPVESLMKVFVSHSSADSPAASAFVKLVRDSLSIPAKDIRCTSVSGYKLPPGANADEQLRKEVFQSDVFVVLLSPKSIQSTYVMFELGARWASGRPLVPIMIDGLTPSALKAPLSAIHCVAGTSQPDLHDVVAELAKATGMPADSAAAYHDALAAFAAAAASSLS